ncbi:MAG: DEAD/DEAH box helicase, partial [Treponema sp.]|nr:DEAD/DEAH box helicase [Treponema sp.]
GLLYTGTSEKRKLYAHQEKSIKTVLKDKKNIVVTTGTGSGKTESFLIPLLSSLLDEASEWRVNKENVLRSLILYPLNALAEDQMVRLRRSLDSEDVKTFLDSYIGNGKRITFGRYNKNTPNKISDVRYVRADNLSRKKPVEITWARVKNQVAQTGNTKLLYSYQNMDANSAEVVTREEMYSDKTPDIIITNYSMLNVMMMREQEAPIFEKTKKYYKNHPDKVFTLVVDELHSYRGTAGAEVSYIIKTLLDRLGLVNDDGTIMTERVRFLSSSASMKRSEATYRFVLDFFGYKSSSVDNKAIFEKYFNLIEDPEKTEIIYDWTSFPLDEILAFNAASDENAISDFSNKYDLISALKALLQSKNEESGKYFYLIKSISDIKKAIIEKLSASGKNISEEKAFLLVKNLLTIINSTKDASGVYKQRLRIHLMARNLDKLWICSDEKCTKCDSSIPSSNRKFGQLYSFSKVNNVCDCGHRIYEAIVCRTCGEIYLGGYILEKGKGRTSKRFFAKDMAFKSLNANENQKKSIVYIPGDSESLQNIRNSVVVSRNTANKDINDEFSLWSEKYLNCRTGEIKTSISKNSSNDYRKVWLYEPDDKVENDYPQLCVKCGTFLKYDKEKFSISPLFHHGTGVQKVNQIFADKLMDILRNDEQNKNKNASNSKLVLFSDSRQNAAKLSAGIELDHYIDSVRKSVIDAINSDCKASSLTNEKIEAIQALKNWYEDSSSDIKKYVDSKIADFIKQDSDLKAIRSKIRDCKDYDEKLSQAEYDSYFSCLADNKSNFKLKDDIVPFVERKLLKVGQNPGGPNKQRIQKCEVRDNNVNYNFSWNEIVDWKKAEVDFFTSF